MRIVDPYARRREPRESVIFAGSQYASTTTLPKDYFLNFNDECFIVADGSNQFPHGDVAAKLACETALWAFKHIRQHRFYWLDKKLFMKRIFRSTNISVWQKKREIGFEDGLATTLVVTVIGGEKFWVGHVGDTSVWLYRNGTIKKITRDDIDTKGRISKLIGRDRFGLIPSFYSDEFRSDDLLLIASSSVIDFVKEQDMMLAFGAGGNTAESLKDAVAKLLALALDRGSDDNMTALLVKRIKNY